MNLRARIEALERRAVRNAPALVVLELHEDDDEAAAERWLRELKAGAPHVVAVMIRLYLPRPPQKPPAWGLTADCQSHRAHWAGWWPNRLEKVGRRRCERPALVTSKRMETATSAQEGIEAQPCLQVQAAASCPGSPKKTSGTERR